MYGHMLLGLKDFVKQTFSDEKWSEICVGAELNPELSYFTYEVYSDELFYQLVTIICKCIESDTAKFLFDFGYYTFSVYWHNSNHVSLLYGLGEDLCELIQSLNGLHHYLSSKYDKMIAPSFSCEATSEGLLVHYKSCRPELGSYVQGIIVSLARHMYRLNVSMGLVQCVDLGSDVVLRYYSQLRVCLKGRLDNKSLSRLQGKSGNDKRQKEIKNHKIPANFHTASSEPRRKKVIRNSTGQIRLYKKEEPWPITPELFNYVAPYHLVFDKKLNILVMGDFFVELLADSPCHREMSLEKMFNIELPTISLTYSNICKEFAGLFILSLKDNIIPPRKKNPAFRGQMLPVTSSADSLIFFIASPSVNTFEDLEEMGLSIVDIQKSDPLHELLEKNNYYNPQMDLSAQLERAKYQLEVEKAEVDLAKSHTDNLLKCMLPAQVACDLKANGYVHPKEYPQVSILFTSISDFDQVCKGNSPHYIVEILNRLFTRFDRLVEVHQVYKVETVGDSYMMTAGFPDTAERHAEAVTNMAFDMRKEVHEMNEQGFNRHSLEIAIGIHSGPVVTGVIGTKLPRYCLFGDTVNTASRMNSTGQPGKIHISESTYKLLLDNGSYHFVHRGQVQVKGLGWRTTYFVEDEQVNVMDHTPYPVLKKVTNISTGRSDASEIENVITQGAANVLPTFLFTDLS